MSEPRARILYIDDDPGLCRLVQKDLERQCYAVEIATDGASGLARIAQGGINVVVLDHYMPNQDGLETLTGIRNLAEPPPVIYLTAMQEGRVAVAALKAGATDYVAKDVQGEFLPLLQRAIDTALDAVMLRRAKEAAEAESKRIWQLAQCIVDTIRDPLVVLEHDMTIVTSNKAFLTIFGISEAETRGRSVTELGQHQWDVPALRHLMERVLQENKPIESFEIEDDFPGLGRRTFNLNVRKVIRPGNNATRMLLVFEDITERKVAEEHVRLLMAEVNHRAKNMLAVVQAVAQQTLRYGDLATYATRLASRIGGLAACQDLLIENLWKGVDVMDLVEIQLAHFKDLIGTRILIDGPRALLTTAAAQGIGMALHELSTNAAKYGALSNSEGKVRIVWQVMAGFKPVFSISWIEDGGPKLVAPIRKGFGQIIIGRMAESAVDGIAEIAFRKEGLEWKLTAPVENAFA